MVNGWYRLDFSCMRCVGAKIWHSTETHATEMLPLFRISLHDQKISLFGCLHVRLASCRGRPCASPLAHQGKSVSLVRVQTTWTDNALWANGLAQGLPLHSETVQAKKNPRNCNEFRGIVHVFFRRSDAGDWPRRVFSVVIWCRRPRVN